MPSDKKRINLTVPDELYEKLQVYKQKNGIINDATACFQLIVQQLQSQEQNEIIMNLMSKATPEQLDDIAKIGLATMHAELGDNTKP